MIFTIDCEKCGGKHKTEIDTKQTTKAQRAGYNGPAFSDQKEIAK